MKRFSFASIILMALLANNAQAQQEVKSKSKKESWLSCNRFRCSNNFNLVKKCIKDVTPLIKNTKCVNAYFSKQLSLKKKKPNEKINYWTNVTTLANQLKPGNEKELLTNWALDNFLKANKTSFWVNLTAAIKEGWYEEQINGTINEIDQPSGILPFSEEQKNRLIKILLKSLKHSLSHFIKNTKLLKTLKKNKDILKHKFPNFIEKTEKFDREGLKELKDIQKTLVSLDQEKLVDTLDVFINNFLTVNNFFNDIKEEYIKETFQKQKLLMNYMLSTQLYHKLLYSSVYSLLIITVLLKGEHLGAVFKESLTYNESPDKLTKYKKFSDLRKELVGQANPLNSILESLMKDPKGDETTYKIEFSQEEKDMINDFSPERRRKYKNLMQDYREIYSFFQKGQYVEAINCLMPEEKRSKTVAQKYRLLSLKYHQDRYTNEDKVFQKVASTIFLILKAAKEKAEVEAAKEKAK